MKNSDHELRAGVIVGYYTLHMIIIYCEVK